jgi:heat shock protein HslJ
MFYKFTLTLAVILASACNPPAATQETPKVPAVKDAVKEVNLTGSVWHYIQLKRWKLIQMNGQMQEQSPIWLEFDTTARRISGNGGCNKLAGAYNLATDTIAFRQIISTRMACVDQAANEREVTFLRLLSDHTYTFDVADQTLQLYDSSKIILMFGAMDKESQQ